MLRTTAIKSSGCWSTTTARRGSRSGPLKNVDAAVARTLAEAARRADCALYAAILHVKVYYASEYPQDLPYGFKLGDSDLEAGEVIDSEHWLDDWVAPDDMRPDYGKLPLGSGELLPRRRSGRRPTGR